MDGRSMTASADLPNKFTGKEHDDDFGLNWDYFGARYYDAVVGRWLSVDPLRNSLTPKELLNSADFLTSPYVHTLNNPVKFVDPNGFDTRGFEFAVLGGGAVGGSIAFGFVTDDQGNAGLFARTGIGGVVGTIGGASAGFSTSNANTIFDLSGLGFSAGFGMGLGFFGAAEFNSALDVSFSGTTSSVGLGSGAGVFLLLEQTFIIQNLDFDKVEGIIEQLKNGEEVSFGKDGNLLLTDSQGNVTDTGVNITHGFEEGTTGGNLFEGIRELLESQDRQ